MERTDLIRLVRATGCAEERGGFVFLCDPRWGDSERAQVRTLQDLAASGRAKDTAGWLCIPTGGTSGRIRFARHDETTLGAAAEGFARHFGFHQVNAVDVLPPFHVSGLMARVRCAVTGGVHVPWEWRRLEAGERPRVTGNDQMISLVPTQLQRLMGSAEAIAWLRGFDVIFLGGAPMWPSLTEAAVRARLPVSLSYGMTETAAMVTASKPAAFLAGDRSAGTPLPHASVSVDADGLIRLQGRSVFRGYFPDFASGDEFVSADLGEVDGEGRLWVLGRPDDVIITGGEKVNPLEVEAALRATGQFMDVAVVGVPHPEWGTEVVACYPPGETAPDIDAVIAAVRETLSAYKRPKRYVAIADWPRNAQGKLSRARLAGRLV